MNSAATTTAALFVAALGKFSVVLNSAQLLGIHRGDRLRRDEATGQPVLVLPDGEYQVIDLAELLGVPVEKSGTGCQVLQMEHGGAKLALRVDRAVAVPRHPAPRLVRSPMTVGQYRVQDAVLLEHATLPLIDLVALFNQDDSTEPPAKPARPSARPASTRLLLIATEPYSANSRRTVGYGVPTNLAEELIDIERMTPLAGAADHVCGLIEWRGLALPLVDLARWCGRPERPMTGKRAAILQLGGHGRIAVVAGSTAVTLSLDTPYTVRDRWLSWPLQNTLGVYEFSNTTAIFPDLQALAHTL